MQPLVSIIVPTYNEEKNITRCMDAIFAQDFPREQFEVLVVDGRSTDSTVSLLDEYDIILLDNPKRDCDDGKYIALQHAQGKYIALIDADNVLASTDWLQKIIQPLEDDETLVGVESNYLVANDFCSINTYATLLVIVDPLARILASQPQSVVSRDGYHLKTYAKNHGPVAGANGFVWRKSVIDTYNSGRNKFAETNLLHEISLQQEVKIANVPDVGIYHYYVKTFSDYMIKRKKIAQKFLNREQSEGDVWVNRNVLFYLKVVYLGTLIGPLFEAMYYLVRTGRVAWLWHPIVSFTTVVVYSFYFLVKK